MARADAGFVSSKMHHLIRSVIPNRDGRLVPTSQRAAPPILHVAAVEFTALRFLRPQLLFLREAGYAVHLACAPDGPSFSGDLAPFTPRAIQFPRRLSPLGVMSASLRLLRLVHELQPAIVHFHSPAAAIPGRLAMLFAWHRPRIIYTVHGFLHQPGDPGIRTRVMDGIENVLAGVTDMMLFQSRGDCEHARAKGFKSQLVYLGNGVGDDWFETNLKRPADKELEVVFVGRLTREKGIVELLEAGSNLAGVRLTLIGDALPSDRDSVASLVGSQAHKSKGRVRWMGMLPEHDVRALLARSNLFVLPSWREGVPRSIIEAMATGLPVVATDIRGCRELVRHRETGWLVAPRNACALRAALSEAAVTPRDVLDKMGAAGRALALKEHRETLVFQRLIEAYSWLESFPA